MCLISQNTLFDFNVGTAIQITCSWLILSAIVFTWKCIRTFCMASSRAATEQPCSALAEEERLSCTHWFNPFLHDVKAGILSSSSSSLTKMLSPNSRLMSKQQNVSDKMIIVR